ncbi:lysylphosphatidylglycerol synthase transmembrane domain-containing protein [Flavobacterium cerinum]|uniref:Flippase-like domain-containing protein n=1 Tax=Flavobacterium cerinum TaxID=2502784 RepID=A0A3S3U0C0_9FLAO|nr:lysylphosphatidylglycerol synthase transmembrane domain-containing protein [Flavobacterium cerinum]RWX00230.1 flippase-like domain-containing protein [Flavobacterium cerinum]
MKKKIGRLLSIILPLLLGVFLVIYTYTSFTAQQIEVISGYFKNADYNYIYISLFIGLTGFIARAYRWKYTLEHLGYHSPFLVNFFAVSICYFMNMTIPRSGEVSRALVLKNYRDVPFDKGFGTIISERVVDLFILIACILGTILLQFDTLKNYISTKVPFEKLLFYGLIAGIVFIGSILFYIYSNAKWLKKLKIKISGLTEGVLSVFKMRKKWPFLLLSLYIWVCYVLMFYVTIFALQETAHISFGVVAVSFVIGSLAITFSNSGFGVFPVAISAVLSLYGVAAEAGTAFGWIVWASQIGLIIFLGSASFLLLPLLYRNK